jgi:cation transport regulator ChaC
VVDLFQGITTVWAVSSQPPSGSFWLFGYGSLIWHPNFEFERRVRGRVSGWQRRFWQGSTDHRGVVGAPGRVVTLRPDAHAECWGVAYEIAAPRANEILPALDHREKGGYERIVCAFEAQDTTHASLGPLEVTAYIATPENENYLGEASLTAMAEQVRKSSGPSGHNAEYVLRLAEALAELDAPDPHVFELANLVMDTHPERGG